MIIIIYNHELLKCRKHFSLLHFLAYILYWRFYSWKIIGIIFMTLLYIIIREQIIRNIFHKWIIDKMILFYCLIPEHRKVCVHD